MKKVLLATSILAATAGFAAAEVTLSGSARMGVIDDFGADNTGFTSRARVVFTLSGETDGGLSFGATFRADNASAANSGDAGEVFMSGAFGKLTMGDIDGAAQQVVGNVDGVGLTGLDDLNEAVYLGAGTSDGGSNSDPTAAYEYSSGAFTAIISATNPDNGVLDDPDTVVDESTPDSDSILALGAKYSTDAFSVGLGYEDADGIDHIVLGGSASFGAVTVKALFGSASGDVDGDQFALSAAYSADALTVTAFYADDEELGGVEAYGLGASYALGGGAKVVGGYSKNDSADTSAVDLGVSFSF
ncbi:MAG: porin [Rhodobacterales bacterium]|nr:MAG: porin [Rhodobacterales bacterium]